MCLVEGDLDDLGAPKPSSNRLQTTYSRQQDADCKTQTHRDAETQDEAKFFAAWWPPQGVPADLRERRILYFGCASYVLGEVPCTVVFFALLVSISSEVL